MARTGENIYKRKDGRWEARYIASYDGNGKAKYKYLYARTYTEVKAKLLKAQNYNHLTNETDKPKGKEKYEYWIDEWLRTKRISVKESTYIRYRNTIENHIKPVLGKYPISKISTSLMEQFVFHKLQNGRIDGHGGLSPKSMSDILVIIKESFKYAQSFGEIVICNFDRISFKKNAQEMRVLSLLEEQRLLSVFLDKECLLLIIVERSHIRVASFNVDPLECPNCSETMEVFEIWYKKTALFDQLRKMLGKPP